MEAKEVIKVEGWNEKFTNKPSTLSHVLLDTSWDFTQFDPEKDNEHRMSNIREYAEALQKTLAAAEAIGEVEHSCDWDPILIIKLRNGETVYSESHYYQIEVGDKEIFIEAPSKKEYRDWGKEAPERFYVDPEVKGVEPTLVIPLAAISLITIDPQ